MKRKFWMITITAFILCLFAFTTGCSSLGGMQTNPEYEWLTGGKKVAKGDKPGDVCISCGENWIFIPNEPNGAVREAQRQGFTSWDCGIKCWEKIHY